jgi:hypothetical protein
MAAPMAAVTSPALAQKADAPPAPAASTLSPDQAKAALDTLQDDVKRKEMIDTLRAIATATPASPEKKPPFRSTPTVLARNCW